MVSPCIVLPDSMLISLVQAFCSQLLVELVKLSFRLLVSLSGGPALLRI